MAGYINSNFPQISSEGVYEPFGVLCWFRSYEILVDFPKCLTFNIEIWGKLELTYPAISIL